MSIEAKRPLARYGDPVLLRYRYRDGSLQAAMPLRVVADTADRLIAWQSPGTQIMYWALPDGTDPRRLDLDQRFHAPLTTAPRTWSGTGVLRVIPLDEPYQVLHFWNVDDEFTDWYINLEAPKERTGDRLDSVDWHLDLVINPDRVPTWKDIDEANAAVAAGQLGSAELQRAWEQGYEIVNRLQDWPDLIGDWRSFAAPADWGPLDLPADWAR